MTLRDMIFWAACVASLVASAGAVAEDESFETDRGDRVVKRHLSVAMGGITTVAAVSDPLAADCSSIGSANVRVLRAPAYGEIAIARTWLRYNSASKDLDARCVGKRLRGLTILYRASPGYRGSDVLEYEANRSNGHLTRQTVILYIPELR